MKTRTPWPCGTTTPPASTTDADSPAPQVLEMLETLNDAIDQLVATVPESLIRRALSAAWFFAERQLREETGRCSVGHDAAAQPAGGCACCLHFNNLKPHAHRWEVAL